MEDMKNSYRILVGNPEGKRPLRTPTLRKDNVKTVFEGIGCALD
jgi:hypothetical protein